MKRSPLLVKLAALTAALLLVALGALHLFWIFGGQWGLVAATPLVDGQPVLEVSARPGFFGLVFLCFMGAYVLLCRGGLLGQALLPGFYSGGTWALIVLLIARAVGDFRSVGLFAPKTDTPFSWYESHLTIPLCLGLAALCLIVAVFSPRRDPE